MQTKTKIKHAVQEGDIFIIDIPESGDWTRVESKRDGNTLGYGVCSWSHLPGISYFTTTDNKRVIVVAKVNGIDFLIQNSTEYTWNSNSNQLTAKNGDKPKTLTENEVDIYWKQSITQ